MSWWIMPCACWRTCNTVVPKLVLPREEKLQNEILNIMIEEIERDGLELMHLRNVPVNEDVPGVAAREVMPDIRQIFVAPMPSLSTASEGEETVSLETKLYKVRKRIERRILPLGIDSFYICSLSSKNIVYKGMLWHLCTAASPPIHSRNGNWLSPSACSAITVR